MTYQGYMALANDDGETIELVNAARVKAYTDNLAPTIGLRGCDDCDGLDEALGETYTTPQADNAPWYDPTDPETADFYGVYPLAFEGIDDSTRTIESAELTGDGSVVVGSRYTGKDIRVSGMAFAKDEAGLYAGMSWLDSALNGTEEGRCFGDRLNLYSSCPPIEVLPSGFAEPWTLPVPVTQDELDAWTTTSGTIVNWPGDGGTDPGLRFNWDLGDPQKIACREITNLIPGEQYQLRMRLENFGDYYVRLGDSCANSRRNQAPNPRLLGWAWGGGGVSDVEADVITGGPLGLGYRQSITTSSNASSPYTVTMPSDEYIPVTPGDLYQASIYVMGPVGTARLSVTFRDGVGSAIASDVRLQTGLALTPAWQRMSGLVTVPIDAATMEVFVATTVGVSAIQPNMEFGVANLLVEHPNFDVVRTNLQIDPRAVGPGSASWSYSVGTGGAATPVFITGAVDGPTLYGTTTSPTYKRNTVNTAPSGGTGGPFLNTTMPSDIPDPIAAGQRWTGGAWFRSNRTVSGTMRYRVINGAAVTIDEFTEPFTLTANVWQYISGSKVAAANLVDAATIQVFAMVGGAGGAAAIQVGDIYETTGGLGQVGISSDETYFDEFRTATGLTAYIPGDSISSSTIAHEVLADAAGTYFDGFTDDFHWEGPANDSPSSSDLGVDYQIVSGWAGDPPTEPTVLDFIPRTESIFLSITPTTIADPVVLTTLLIEEALVRRTPRPGVVAFGSGNEYVPPSDGWTHLVPDTMQVNWVVGEQTQFDSVRTDGQAPFGSALTYLASTHGVQRTIFGLIPGNRYRLMVEFSEQYSVTDAGPFQTLNPIVSLSNTSGAIATYEEDNGTVHYWVVEFTADATSSLLRFSPNANLALGSFGSVIWSFDQYMVEEILQTDATEPRPGRFQERTMYEVKASQGPILTNVRTSPCGVMGQVTFSIRAGNPFKYRAPIFAGGLPTGTSSVVSDIPCSADGLPQVINFAYNPSLETNATDWGAGGTNVTSGRTNTFGGYIGDYVFQASAVPGSGRVNQITTYYFPPASGPVPVGGEEITVSFYFRTLDLSSLGTYEWLVYVTSTGFDPMQFNGTTVVSVAETWYRVEQTFTLPGNIPLSVIEISLFLPDSVTTGGSYMMDALMIQRGSVATDPFDETMPGVEWTGTANASALALTPFVVDLSADPDCPAPPAPPAPPVIDEDCVDSPTSYNRTVVNISADTVPQNLTAYPVITLTAGSEPVRQARIRFWENPDNMTIENLDPCSYDGEIIVSFLADGATMVIDGVLREATVSKPGFEDQNANHALYGPDGGPVDWPELTGGIPYLVTLELDSAAPYTDTLMSVDLVVKD